MNSVFQIHVSHPDNSIYFFTDKSCTHSIIHFVGFLYPFVFPISSFFLLVLCLNIEKCPPVLTLSLLYLYYIFYIFSLLFTIIIFVSTCLVSSLFSSRAHSKLLNFPFIIGNNHIISKSTVCNLYA